MNKRETEEGIRNVEFGIFRSKSVVYMKFISHVYIKMGSRSNVGFNFQRPRRNRINTTKLEIYRFFLACYHQSRSAMWLVLRECLVFYCHTQLYPESSIDGTLILIRRLSVKSGLGMNRVGNSKLFVFVRRFGEL